MDRKPALASAFAMLIIFVGLCHEVVGAVLFPWGYDFLGGAIGWHGLGIGGMAVAAVLLAATLRLVWLPMWATSAICLGFALLGAGLAVLAAVLHGDVHFFALVVVVAAGGVAFFHRPVPASAIRLGVGGPRPPLP